MNRDVLGQLEAVTHRLVDALVEVDDDTLHADSQLPGWSRLTIACHLRYGARALQWMTEDACAGRPTAFYPEGRTGQRPATLVPDDGESPVDVVRSLAAESAALHHRWRAVDDWDVAVHEPPDRADLGRVTLGQLAILRLTEVEVHSTDLALDLGPWSDVFVRAALAMRLAWLPERRRDRTDEPSDDVRSWLLVPTDDDAAWRITVAGGTVSSSPAGAGDGAEVVIEAPSRDLLELLLGRRAIPGSESFRQQFPGP